MEETLGASGIENNYLVNGDDHIIPANSETLIHYKRITSALGFKINKEKSIKSRKFVCLNSTLITVSGRRIHYANLAFLGK